MRAPALPVAAGIGLRLPHVRALLESRPTLAWVEAHPENFFGGGANRAALHRVRETYPIALHGVGLGLGSPDPLDAAHLDALATLADEIEAVAVSEHLCWNRLDGVHYHDLLPLPGTVEALDLMAARVDTVQTRLGRRLLIENLSRYVRFAESTLSEGEFLAALVARTGCGLLLDVNNLYVNALNFGEDPMHTVAALPAEAIFELHIAGHAQGAGGLFIDTHGTPVCDAVWQLLDAVLARIGPRPVLLERDTELPPLEELLAERDRAQALLDAHQ